MRDRARAMPHGFAPLVIRSLRTLPPHDLRGRRYDRLRRARRVARRMPLLRELRVPSREAVGDGEALPVAEGTATRRTTSARDALRCAGAPGVVRSPRAEPPHANV